MVIRERRKIENKNKQVPKRITIRVNDLCDKDNGPSLFYEMCIARGTL
jgi:hypothetical protein